MRNQPRTQSGTGIDQPPATAAHAAKREMRDAYAAAVSHGARNTRCAPDEERAYGTLRLLTLATLRLPDLFLYAHVAQAFCEDPEVDRVPAVVVDAVRAIAAGALRLAHRALETHAREQAVNPACGLTGRSSGPARGSPARSRLTSRRCWTTRDGRRSR